MGLQTAQLMARLPGASNQQTRHARRLYIGGCPKTSEEEMTTFFNAAINRALLEPVEGGPVASVYVSQEKVINPARRKKCFCHCLFARRE